MVIAASAPLWLLAAGSVLLVGTGPVAHAAQVKHAPAAHGSPAHKSTMSARPPAQPGLSISITDGRSAAARGERLRYVVMIRNSGAATARNLRITLTLPPYLSVRSASGSAAAKAGKLTWRASLRPGRTASFSAAAILGKTPRGMGHLAVVACAEQHSATPVVCAAHLDRLPGAAGTTSSDSGTARGGAAGSSAAPGSGGGLARYLFTGLAVLACVLLAALTARRIRGRRQPGHAR